MEIIHYFINRTTILFVYVDDIIITGEGEVERIRLERILMSDLI